QFRRRGERRPAPASGRLAAGSRSSCRCAAAFRPLEGVSGNAERACLLLVGSIISDLVIPPAERVDKGYAWNCLYHREGSCGACIGRCPVGAISFSGHDKERCCEYVYKTLPAAVAEKYGVTATGCGLCQTRVPCESAIPRSRK